MRIQDLCPLARVVIISLIVTMSIPAYGRPELSLLSSWVSV